MSRKLVNKVCPRQVAEAEGWQQTDSGEAAIQIQTDNIILHTNIVWDNPVDHHCCITFFFYTTFIIYNNNIIWITLF